MKPKKITAYVVFTRYKGEHPFTHSYTQKRWAERTANRFRRRDCKVVIKTVTVTL